MQEKITIIMTSYNYANYISEAIESVLNQTYKNWELLIIDDGSTDNSLNIIKKYLNEDSRIRLLQHDGAINKGLAESIKLGIAHTKTNWVAFLECDDKFTENSLEAKIATIKENPEIDLLFTDLIMFQDKKKIAGFLKYFDDIDNLFYKRDEAGYLVNFKDHISKINLIPTFSVVIVKKFLLESCNFKSPWKASLDYYLWAQLCNSKIYYLNKKLTHWRIHSDSYINREKHSWLEKYLFRIIIYSHTINNKNILLKTLLILNFMRARLIYIKINKEKFKINLFNNKFIFEKKF